MEQNFFERIKNSFLTEVMITILAGSIAFTPLYAKKGEKAEEKKEPAKLEETVKKVYEPPKIAILDLDAKKYDKEDAEMNSELLRTKFFDFGKYKLITQEEMDEILKEQEFQMSGCTESACAVEIGKLLSAEYIVNGKIGTLKSGKAYIFANVFSVQTGEAVYKKGTKYYNAEVMERKVGGIFRQIAEEAYPAILKHQGISVEEIDKVLEESAPVKEEVKKEYEKRVEIPAKKKEEKKKKKKEEEKAWYGTWYGMTGIGVAAGGVGYGIYALTRDDGGTDGDTTLPPGDDGPIANKGTGDDKDGKDQPKTIIKFGMVGSMGNNYSVLQVSAVENITENNSKNNKRELNYNIKAGFVIPLN